jgi:hypothetical protein
VGAQGNTVIDFGAFPGGQTATGTVTGQTQLLSTSLAEAWINPTVATADHSIDEQVMDWQRIQMVVVNIVAGVGFTIVAQLYPNQPNLYGKYNVAWVWN